MLSEERVERPSSRASEESPWAQRVQERAATKHIARRAGRAPITAPPRGGGPGITSILGFTRIVLGFLARKVWIIANRPKINHYSYYSYTPS